MTLLKRIGQIIVQGLQIVTGIGPIITATNPNAAAVVSKVESELNQLAGIVTTVEAIGASLGLPGTDKIRAAGPLVGQLILKSDMMIGQTVADGPKFAQACQTIAGGIADLLNSLKAPS